MIWYCDTSALLKRYVREVGSRWLRQQVSRYELLVSELVIAELPSALARQQRQGLISQREFHSGRNQFTHHLRNGRYRLLPTTRPILDQAALLIYRYPLAAYDAVHLASALAYLRASGLNAKQFHFVTADNQLQRAAAAEGLQIENPNAHP